MLERFRQHLRTSGLIPRDKLVLVGYSGGADSTCLLHLLKSCGIDLAAAHLHHGQRPEADQELELCEALCIDLGVPFLSGHADVPTMAHHLKIGLEEAGREARYAFLGNAARRLQCDLIATAHTRDDLIETVLLNVTRGCGLHGLTGIPERRENIVRPCLVFSREEMREYCDRHGFWYHDDPSNSDLSFSRARIRHRVVRELRTINPSFDHVISRTVEILSEEDRFLNGMAAAALEQSKQPLNGALRFLTIDCEVAFDRNRLAALPPVLFKRGIRLAVQVLGSGLDYVQTGAIVTGVATSGQGAVTSEEGTVAVEWNPKTIHVRRLDVAPPFRQPLTFPGETICEELGWVLAAAHDSRRPDRMDRTDLTVAMNPSNLKGQLHCRSVRPGDEMQPAGFSGHRKVSTLLSEAKLTKAARARLPIICDMLGPIWVPGVCFENRIMPDSDAEEVILLGFRSRERAEGHNVGNAGEGLYVTDT